MAKGAAKDDNKYTSWVSEGRSHQKRHDENWGRWLGYLSNKSALKMGPREYRIFINLAMMNWQNLRPNLYFKNPKFKARPRPTTNLPNGVDGMLAARLIENAIDQFSRENNLKKEAKLCVIEALAIGVSVFKSGYHIPTKNIKKKRANLKKLSGLSEQMGVEDAEVSKAIKQLEQADLEAMALHDIPDREMLWGRWTSLKNILLPYGYGNWLSDCPWVAERIEKRKGDALDDYPLIGELGLEPTGISDYARDGKPDVYEIYEIWDWLDRKRVYTVPDKNRDQNIVKTLDWPKGLEKYPYEELKFSEAPGQFYSPPDIEFYESLMEILSETLSMAVGHLRRFKTLYKNDVPLSENQKARLESPQDGDCLDDPEFKSLMPIERPPAPPEIEPVVNKMLYFADQIAGMTQTRRGSGKKLTATQIMEESEGLDVRQDERLDILEDWLGNIGRTQMKLIQKNLSSPLMIELSPQEAQVFGLKNPWIRATQEQINAELDLWVVAGSTAKDDPNSGKQSYDTWFNLSSQLPWVDQRLLWQKYSLKVLDLPREEIEEVLLPEQDPDAVGLAELEGRLIMMGQPVAPAQPEQSHEIHMEVHQRQLAELQALPQQWQEMQMQAQMYAASGAPLPNDLNMQMQQMQQQLQVAQWADQQLQAMIAAHQQFLQGVKPLNYNLLNQKKPGGTVIDGGSTPAEAAGGIPAA